MKKHCIRSIKSLTLAMLCIFSIAISFGMGHGDGSLVPLPDKGTRTVPMDAGTPLATLQCNYFDEKDFMNSVIAARQNQLTVNRDKSTAGQIDTVNTDKSGSIAGGIVPHHLLASKMIAEFFQSLAVSVPEIVVVIAPNHERIGLNDLHTSTQNWGTAFGVLEANPVLTEKLIDDLRASQNSALMEEEHSISSLVPYIKYYLPKAKIVPVLLHGNYSPEASQRLGELLAEALSGNPRAVVIASVDFSHYLDADTADKMDEKTLAAIKSNDIQLISRMGNDNLDSPPSIIALLSAMEKIGAAAPEVIGHGNSSDITGSGADYTTSYYTMLYKR